MTDTNVDLFNAAVTRVNAQYWEGIAKSQENYNTVYHNSVETRIKGLELATDDATRVTAATRHREAMRSAGTALQVERDAWARLRLKGLQEAARAFLDA
jgi:hypothetical protein